MPLPSCLVVAPWEAPAAEHAVVALAPVVRPARASIDPNRAAAVLRSADGDAANFRQFTKVAPSVADRSPEMDAFCNERLAKGQTWNMAGMLHLMSDGAALETIARAKPQLSPSYLVARFGDRGAELALSMIEADARDIIEKVGYVDAIELARICARDFGKAARRAAALAYFARYPETAALAAIPMALAKGKARATGREALRGLAREHAMVVAEVAARFGEAAQRAVEHVLRTSEPLPAPKLPAFADAQALPAPIVRAAREPLPRDATQKLLGILAVSTLAEPRAELDEIRAALDERSLAEFAWALARAWLAEGGPPKEDWAFAALGHFGDDDVARKLAPLVRAYPAEGFSKRAQLGLDVLAAIGTDVALMHLHAIALGIKFKALEEHARAKISEVARSRGLTDDELGDRLVPTLGLDERGGLDLDFGPRAFRVTFDEQLQPRVVVEGGAIAEDLPRVRQGDDPHKAEEAIARWRALKQDAKTIAQSQVGRLELAMSNARAWRAADFRRLIVAHPLLVHLARRLVWRVVGADACFRVDESGALSDASDAPFELAGDARVSLLHPVDVAPSVVHAFGELFADYRVLQPFEQLGRAVHRLDPSDLAVHALARWDGRACPTQSLLHLDRRAWRYGEFEDDYVNSMIKRVGAHEVTLHFMDGFAPDAPMETPEQTIGKITLPLPKRFGDLAPSQISDLIRDVERLFAA
jgi:hypothetical protein